MTHRNRPDHGKWARSRNLITATRSSEQPGKLETTVDR
jgi:hypothetical protein